MADSNVQQKLLERIHYLATTSDQLSADDRLDLIAANASEGIGILALGSHSNGG